jgi:hypothetical protein
VSIYNLTLNIHPIITLSKVSYDDHNSVHCALHLFKKIGTTRDQLKAHVLRQGNGIGSVSITGTTEGFPAQPQPGEQRRQVNQPLMTDMTNGPGKV